jgi:8-oxo-dGTP pyrophosphatase MutT (NUDIX family)
MIQTKNGPHIVVGGILLNKDDCVFLARFPKWGNKWAIPGGKVQYGESLFQALQREIKEETALEVVTAELLRVSESICDPSFRDGSWHMLLLDYVVRDFIGEPLLDQRELLGFRWEPLQQSLSLELTPPTHASIRYLLEARDRNGSCYR